MPETQVDLGSLFGAVSASLAENRDSLNQADAYNANHGDNMVKNFRTISRAVNQKKGSTPTDQLAYASQVLGKNVASGSARMYSQGLAQAAEQLRGHPAVTQDNAMVLLQSLLGGQSAPTSSQGAAAGDPLSGLLGAIMGGGQTEGQANPQTDMLGGLLSSMLGGTSGQAPEQFGSPSGQANQQEDMLGGLLSSMMGGASGQSQPQPQPSAPTGQAGGMNMNTLLTAGMAFLQARQQGSSTVQALVNALMAGSQMNSSPHHSQSGQLVATTLINTISSMLAKPQQ